MNYHNEKVEKPRTTADARRVNFPKFGGQSAPLGVRIGAVTEFLQVMHTNPLVICYNFEAVSHSIFLTTRFGKAGRL